MKILLFSKYDRKGASSRVRTLQYISYLEKAGHSIVVYPLFTREYLESLYTSHTRPFPLVLKSYWNRFRKLQELRDFDAVWIEKELFPWLPFFEERILSKWKIPYIVDYDDSIFHKYDIHSNPMIRKFLGRKIDSVMNNASVVITGNDYLAKKAISSGANRVEILPSSINLKNYPETQRQRNESFTIGWIGTPTTLPYLKMIEDPLMEFCQGRDISLSIVGVKNFEVGNIRTECHEWSEENEAELIDQFDAGIMPLPDEPWERGKCGYKLIQYMGCFKPVIASPVGVNNNIVVQGGNGFLAENSKEWLEAFTYLYLQKDRALEMGRAGRSLVEKHYCTDVIAPKLEQIIGSLKRGF